MAAYLDNYWIVWPVGIALWLIIGWAEFGYFETKALDNPTPTHITLSYFVFYVTSKFPLATFYGGLLLGLFVGSLSTHFWWHWLPPGAVSAG
ncbi:hypothetical protein [Bradyrhizobium sp. Tv2a-2]|uniref:hypothetical protein n=1 Tax=Bradyrhizobium sp. Tv2a-2 TaxID=113395 RepID=UPI000414B64C|nr:hypothetical protein [Bradyrhizobium sp. Tv2a-2]